MFNQLRIFIYLFCAMAGMSNSASGQKVTNEFGTGYDSLAIDNAKTLAGNYLNAMNSLFNQPLNATGDSEQYFFTGLFDEAAFVFQDYTVEKGFRNPSDYYHYANKYFREVNPVYEGRVVWESLELEYYQIDDYYIGKILIENTFSRLLNLSNVLLEEQTQKGMVTIEMKIGKTSLTSSIIMVEEYTPPETASLTLEEVKTQKVKQERIKKPDSGSTRDNSVLAFISFVYGSDLGLSRFTSESSEFEVSSHKNSSYGFSVNALIPFSKNGFFISAGLGFSNSQLELSYENTEYSFNFSDNLNPATNTTYASAANVDSYIRTVELSDMIETINYQDISIQLMLSKNLANSSSNKYLFISGGIAVAVPFSETSNLTNNSNYYGHFDEINGNPADLTLGLDEEIPEYGFNRQNNEFDFDFDANPILNGLIELNGGVSFAGNLYAGLGIQGLLPLNNWLDGQSNHETLFRTNSDLSNSLANTVIKSNRPIRLGVSIQFGILF